MRGYLEHIKKVKVNIQHLELKNRVNIAYAEESIYRMNQIPPYANTWKKMKESHIKNHLIWV